MKLRATCLLLCLNMAGCSDLFGPAWEPVDLTDDPAKLNILRGTGPPAAHMPQPPEPELHSHRWYNQKSDLKPVISGKRSRMWLTAEPTAKEREFDPRVLSDALDTASAPR